MSKKYNVLIVGDGRIGQAVTSILKKWRRINSVRFYSAQQNVSSCDFFFGALPGALGEQSLNLALKYRKPLIDIADIDPPFYLKHASAIKKNNLLVVPECGFSPGLVNLILGYLIKKYCPVSRIEVAVGSLTKEKNTFPFLWCFEDLIAEHQLSSWQLVGGEKVKCPPFGDYRKETFFGIPAESCLCASGFEQFLSAPGLKSFTTRVVRPRGYQLFYEQLRSQGFFRKGHFDQTKKILEGQKFDNMTFAIVNVVSRKRRLSWVIKSSASKREKMNSMQKITVSLPVVLARWILTGKISQPGLKFAESFARDPEIFNALLKDVQKNGVDVFVN
ncbi:MAG: hypothetical protein K8S27_07275 [Candidatus Omnitrophica bacterium]|nr:hypothetical protein [Candidatus Omnitrophota bacterium]